MSYKAEVLTAGDPKYYDNALRFATAAEAEDYGHDLAMRWTAVEDMRVVESGDAASHVWRHGRARQL
jgi:hypothetical protein